MNFLCSCCGRRFESTLEVQKKFDRDKGYGLCEPCEKWIEDRERIDTINLIASFREHLSDANKLKFDQMSEEEKNVVLNLALDESVIKFSIRRS